MDELYYLFNPWWEDKPFSSGILREKYLLGLQNFLNRKQINIIIGSRRTGKTTILKQIIKQLLEKGTSPKSIFYLAMDHQKLSKISIYDHIKKFRALFMHKRETKIWLFLDEIQESSNWEGELKSIYDTENIKTVCTGSTASLLTSQGGKLTGRQIVTTIYPLNFKEFLLFKNENPSKSEDYKYEKLIEEYFETGGYPENVLQPSFEYLNNLLDDIIARDIVRLFQIRKHQLLKDLLLLIASSVGSRTSYNKLSHTLNISVDTTKDYINFLESAFLIKPMEKWTTSYSQKIYSAKKIYFLDIGIKSLLTGKGDFGAKAENLVFLKLLRQKINYGYFAESQKEVDMIIGNIKEPLPVEVKYDSKFDWQDKRFSGLKLFLNKHPQTPRALVITKDIETEIKEGKTVINVIPLWKFLLQDFMV